MNTSNFKTAISQYTQVKTESQVPFATPHRLIQMLMEGVLEKIACAKRHMLNQDVARKGENISLAISIVSGLRASLDKEKGLEIAESLDRLYDYMERRLVEANARNNPTGLDEVAKLMREIKDGWDAIEGTLSSVTPHQK